MRIEKALLSGAAGAAVLTLGHEILRRLEPRAPRLDKIGMLALRRVLQSVGVRPPRGERSRGYALLADLVTNTLYFAPSGATRHAGSTGGALGILAGLGSVFLTPRLGIPTRYRGRGLKGQLLAIGLYTLGGLAASAMARALTAPTRDPAI